MKRLLLFMLMLLFLPPALAEDDPTALFSAAHPGYQIVCSDQEGDVAAAILTNEEEHVLCIAERTNGAWALTIDSDKALRQHEAYINYELAVDPESFDVSWSCQPWDTREAYVTVRENGIWKAPSLDFLTPWGDDFRCVTLSWGNGLLTRTESISDENAIVLSTTELCPLPASWLDGMTTLEGFDVSLLPTFQADIPTVMEGRALALAAEELLPGYAYVGGSLLKDELQLLLDKPDGTRVFVGAVYDSGWKLTESAPLPKDACYGYENFTDYLHIPDLATIGVRHWPDGTWGVDFLLPDAGPMAGDMFLLGQNYFSHTKFSYSHESLLIGDLPWSDLTTIDWAALPLTMDEARAAIDNSGWAIVNNPNPEDRLHLRVEPDRSAASQGKYYNGTFVRILERQGTWTKVDVFGTEGWMMTDYLSIGDDMERVHIACPMQFVQEWLPFATLYQTPGGAEIGQATGTVRVLGIVGDEWCHVWLDDDRTGYLRQADLWEGNG